MIKKTALITGAPGQLAHYCSDFLLDKDYDVVLTHNTNPDKNISSGATQIKLDITNFQEVKSIIEGFSPDEVYNFAAISSPPQCESAPLNALDANIAGPSNILQAIKESGRKDCVFFQAGSINQIIINSFYSLTKALTTDIVLYYAQHFGVRAYIGLLPHCESPIRGGDFFIGKLIKWLKGFMQAMKNSGFSEEDLEFSTNEILVFYHNEIVFRYPKIRLGNLYNTTSWVAATDAISMIHHYIHNNRDPLFTIDRGLHYNPAELMEAIIKKVGFTKEWGSFYVYDPILNKNKIKIEDSEFNCNSMDVEGNLDNFISFLTKDLHQPLHLH